MASRAHADRPRILFISTVPTHPSNAGNRQRALSLLEAIESFGFDFRFLAIQQEDGDAAEMAARWGPDRLLLFPHACPRLPDPLWRKVRNRAMRYTRGERFHPMSVDAFRWDPLAAFVRQAARDFQPTCVVVMYVFWSWLLDLFPAHVHRLVDTNDIMADRYRRFLDAGTQPEWWSISRRAERHGLRRASCVVAIQEREAAYFRQLVDVPVTTVGHLTPVRHLPPSAAAVPTVLFVGSSNGINQDGVKWLLAEPWPQIRARCPSARLQVVGTIGRALKGWPVPAGVEMLGTVDDLTARYADAHVVVNPLRFGTGLKIKSVEALGYGRAVVSTTIGAEGLDAAIGHGISIGDTPDAFAAHCVKLLEDPTARRNQQEAAVQFLQRWNQDYRAALRGALVGAPGDALSWASG